VALDMTVGMMETKIAWISALETREDALTVVKQGTFAFFFLAALHVLLYLVLKSYVPLIDAAVIVVGALAIRELHSRSAALVLAAIACAEAGVTFANELGANLGGGSNIVLAGLMVWVAVRTLQATSALERMPPDEDEEDEDER
jgi:hypothetical protein